MSQNHHKIHHSKNDFFENYLQDTKLLSFVIFLNIIMYSYIIHLLPDFYTDDFSIFTLVKNYLHSGEYIPPDSMHYLYWRPITFIFFLVDNFIFDKNSLIIKYISLFIHIFLLIIIYYTIQKLIDIFKIKNSKINIFIILIAISFHPVTYKYIIWIANKNSLLMEVFYVLSFLFTLIYFQTKKIRYIYISIISFLLSLLCKQNAASLPFVVLILFIYFYKIFDKTDKKYILINIITNTIIVLIYSFTYFLYYSDYDFSFFLIHIYKKPFVIVSSIIYFLFPYKIYNIYYFFIDYYYFTVLIFLLIIIFFISLICKKFNINKYVLFVFIIAVSFFPQMLIANQFRNFNIQILILFISIITLVSGKIKKYLYIFLLCLIIIYSISIFDSINQDILINKYYNNSIELFINKKYNNEDIAIILSLDDVLNLPYQYHYLTYNDFGKIKIDLERINFFIREDKITSENISSKVVTLKKEGDTLKYKINDSIALFSFYGNINIFEEKKSKISRGFTEFSYVIPERFRNKILVYFDGSDWKELQ